MVLLDSATEHCSDLVKACKAFLFSIFYILSSEFVETADPKASAELICFSDTKSQQEMALQLGDPRDPIVTPAPPKTCHLFPAAYVSISELWFHSQTAPAARLPPC